MATPPDPLLRHVLQGVALSVILVAVASIVPRLAGAPEVVALNTAVAAVLLVGLAAFVWVPLVVAPSLLRRAKGRYGVLAQSTPGAEDWVAVYARTPGARLRYTAVRVTRDVTGLTLVTADRPPIVVPWSSIRTVTTPFRKVWGRRRVLLITGLGVRLVVVPFRNGSFVSNHGVLTYAAELLER